MDWFIVLLLVFAAIGVVGVFCVILYAIDRVRDFLTDIRGLKALVRVQAEDYQGLEQRMHTLASESNLIWTGHHDLVKRVAALELDLEQRRMAKKMSDPADTAPEVRKTNAKIYSTGTKRGRR